jgi:hypothetical protein
MGIQRKDFNQSARGTVRLPRVGDADGIYCVKQISSLSLSYYFCALRKILRKVVEGDLVIVFVLR